MGYHGRVSSGDGFAESAVSSFQRGCMLRDDVFVPAVLQEVQRPADVFGTFQCGHIGNWLCLGQQTHSVVLVSVEVLGKPAYPASSALEGHGDYLFGELLAFCFCARSLDQEAQTQYEYRGSALHLRRHDGAGPGEPRILSFQCFAQDSLGRSGGDQVVAAQQGYSVLRHSVE